MQKCIHLCINMQSSAQEFRREWPGSSANIRRKSGETLPSWRELRRLIRFRRTDRCKSCGKSGGLVFCLLAVVDGRRNPLRESWPELSRLAELSALAATGLASSDRRRMCQVQRLACHGRTVGGVGCKRRRMVCALAAILPE